MEIKHTIEILTKDIQDIEKLVRNLNNYETPPQIEIDLAMSRLRNVYDLLSLISNDMRTDHLARQQQAAVHKEPEGQESAPPQEQKPQQEPASSQQDTVQQKPVEQQEKAAQQQPPAELQQNTQQQPAEQQQNTQQQPAEQQQPPAEQQQKTQQQSTGTREQAPPQPQSSAPPQTSGKTTDTPPQEQQSPQSAGELKTEGSDAASGTEQKKKEEAKKTSILAEKFASDRSLNEKISPGSGHDLSSKLTGEPIDSIKRNIGINDRFLIIRELLDGDSEAFNDLVQKLDTQHRFDEAYEIIQSLFPEQMEHDGVNLLVRLSRRRYLGR